MELSKKLSAAAEVSDTSVLKEGDVITIDGYYEPDFKKREYKKNLQKFIVKESTKDGYVLERVE